MENFIQFSQISRPTRLVLHLTVVPAEPLDALVLVRPSKARMQASSARLIGLSSSSLQTETAEMLAEKNQLNLLHFRPDSTERVKIAQFVRCASSPGNIVLQRAINLSS